MSADVITRTTGGRFGPGRSANPAGRPTNERRMFLVVERVLQDSGASKEEIQSLARAARDPLQAAAAIAVMAVAVAERREQNTPGPAAEHLPDLSPAR
ncbi:MAG: hypothetical protein C5B56_05280 [Proteobacteria bacterium]|nr:MAG: hypothetical protein C5B56_05280 [Pseudomonadota bacterium]